MATPCCFTGSEHPGTPLGHEETIHGLPTYVSGPSDGSPKAIVVIIPDAFGWRFKNLRLLSDIYAKRIGARVLMPDFMDGHNCDPSTIQTLDVVTGPAPSWLAVLTTKIPAIISLISNFVPFIYYNRQSIAEPRIRKWFTSLRETTPNTLKIGAAGFCWGGKYVTLFTHPDALTPSGLPLIDAGFTAHPSNLVLPNDIDKVEKPLSISIGDVDMAMSIDKVNEAKRILSEKPDAEANYEVVILPGAKHGFAVRAHPGDERETEQALVAEDQAVRWFERFLM